MEDAIIKLTEITKKQAELIDECVDRIIRLESMLLVKEKKRWCAVHPLGIWANGFNRCTIGNKRNENCKEGVNES